MSVPAAHADPMLERAVRLGALIAQLPALPVHDWLDRAAAAVAEAIPGATVLSLLTLPGPEPAIERIGAAGCHAEDLDRSPRAMMLRLERLPHSKAPLLIEPTPVYFCRRLGDPFASSEVCLTASAPLARGQSRTLYLMVAAEAEAQAAPVLHLAMPDLARRALAAVGPEPAGASQWLLPGDLQLIEGLVAGKTIPEIARDTDRKEHAVQDAVKAMYRRLGRNRRTDLVARAVGHVPASEIEGKR